MPRNGLTAALARVLEEVALTAVRGAGRLSQHTYTVRKLPRGSTTRKRTAGKKSQRLILMDGEDDRKSLRDLYMVDSDSDSDSDSDDEREESPHALHAVDSDNEDQPGPELAQTKPLAGQFKYYPALLDCLSEGFVPKPPKLTYGPVSPTCFTWQETHLVDEDLQASEEDQDTDVAVIMSNSVSNVPDEACNREDSPAAPPDTANHKRVCIDCNQSKSVSEFHPIPSDCQHSRGICRPCVRQFLRSEVERGLLNIRCSDCQKSLHHKDVSPKSDSETSSKHEGPAHNHATSKRDTFFSCNSGNGPGKRSSPGAVRYQPPAVTNDPTAEEPRGRRRHMPSAATFSRESAGETAASGGRAGGRKRGEDIKGKGKCISAEDDA